MPEMFSQDDANFVLRRVEDLVKFLGYEPVPQSLKLTAPPPIDDFELRRHITWRFAIDGDDLWLFGERLDVGSIYEPISKSDTLLDILRSVAFFVGLKERAEYDFIRAAMFANKFREGEDTLFMTLLKMKLRRIWDKMKYSLALRFNKNSGKTRTGFRLD